MSQAMGDVLRRGLDRWWRTLLVLTVTLVLAACAPQRGGSKKSLRTLLPQSPPVAVRSTLTPTLLREERLYLAHHFDSVLDKVQRYYVDTVDLRAFARAGLNALGRYEQSVQAGVSDDEIILRMGNTVRRYPYRSDVHQPRRSRVALAVAMARAVSGARASSPLLARLSSADLEDTVMDGALGSLDAMSYYLGPEQVRAVRQRPPAGIGVEVETRYDHLAITRVMQSGPAYQAGLRPGDAITHIQGRALIGLPGYFSTGLLYGEANEPVTLTVIEAGHERSVTLRRSRVRYDDVDGRWLAGDLIYLKIHHFGAGTLKAFNTHWQALTAGRETPRGIVLDLRGNPGGLLRTATGIADVFIDHGVIMRVAGREGQADKTVRAGAPERLPAVPLVVLIDGMTASAAEVMSAALQDHERAVLVGSRSYGMGMMKGLFPVAKGVGMQLTTARIYRPNGALLHKQGVTPDICTAERVRVRSDARVGAIIADAARSRHAPCVREIYAARGVDLELAVATRLLRDRAGYRRFASGR